jgi:putative peptidoglycan lipid II flippase
VRAIAYLVLPAAAAMLSLSLPMARVLRFGAYDGGGVGAVAAATAAFGPGLVGYGTFLFLARALYARGDTRTPAMVNLAVVAAGGVGMVITFSLVHGNARLAALAGAHSAAYLVGSGVLYLIVRARSAAGAGHVGIVGRSLLASTGAAAAAGAVMWFVGDAMGGGGRAHSLVELLVAGGSGVLVYVVGAVVLGGPRPSAVPALLRGGHV